MCIDGYDFTRATVHPRTLSGALATQLPNVARELRDDQRDERARPGVAVETQRVKGGEHLQTDDVAALAAGGGGACGGGWKRMEEEYDE